VWAGRDLQLEAARVVHLDRLSIECQIDAAAGTRATPAEREVVLGIEWERVVNQHAATRAQRKSLDVTVLREATWRRERDLCGAHRSIADGETADLHRRRHVALNERGRRGERFREIVEALARSVGRQQRVHVDVERKQIANRVGVFGPIQAMQRGRRQRGGRIGRAIETRFQLGGKCIEPRSIGPLRTARRHHAGADLLDDLFPRLDVAADLRDVEPIELETRRFQPLIVTGDAVLIEERRLGRCRGCGLRCWSGLPLCFDAGARDHHDEHADE
jgi:hypothetical protein